MTVATRAQLLSRGLRRGYLTVGFRRGPNAMGPGTGLGLAAAAAAIRAHHGTLGVEPRSGGGAPLWIRLPV